MSKEFSLDELSQYDGVKRDEIYISVRGKVYDMTPGKDFYGPGIRSPSNSLTFLRGFSRLAACVQDRIMIRFFDVDRGRLPCLCGKRLQQGTSENVPFRRRLHWQTRRSR